MRERPSLPSFAAFEPAFPGSPSPLLRQAYWSLVWNRMASYRLRELGQEPVEGDLVLVSGAGRDSGGEAGAAGAGREGLSGSHVSCFGSRGGESAWRFSDAEVQGQAGAWSPRVDRVPRLPVDFARHVQESLFDIGRLLHENFPCISAR